MVPLAGETTSNDLRSALSLPRFSAALVWSRFAFCTAWRFCSSVLGRISILSWKVISPIAAEDFFSVSCCGSEILSWRSILILDNRKFSLARSKLFLARFKIISSVSSVRSSASYIFSNCSYSSLA